VEVSYLAILFMVLAYLSGSLCSAIIISNAFNLPDPRSEGSKNPGATNVLRLAGKKYAGIVLFFDCFKGFLPVLIAKLVGVSPVGLSYVCFAAVFGHMFPVFYQFRGGKGIATAMGALLAFHLMLGTMVIATWLVVANFTRYSSAASIISMVLAPFFSVMVVNSVLIVPPFIFIALFVLFKHRNNLTRLMDGVEPKIGRTTPEGELESLEEPTPIEISQTKESGIIKEVEVGCEAVEVPDVKEKPQEDIESAEAEEKEILDQTMKKE